MEIASLAPPDLLYLTRRFHDGTVNLTIKNIPQGIYKVLKRTAAEKGRSLNAEAIRALAHATEEAERRRRMRESRADLERFVKR